MATSSVSCCLGPPAPPREAAKTAGGSLRRACVAAAACAVMGMADGAGADMAVLARDVTAASRAGDVAAAVGATPAKARPRWSERRQCPPWRANSLENIVPENLPRAPARRRFSSVSISAEALAAAPDLVVVHPFPAAEPAGTGCFSL